MVYRSTDKEEPQYYHILQYFSPNGSLLFDWLERLQLLPEGANVIRIVARRADKPMDLF